MNLTIDLLESPEKQKEVVLKKLYEMANTQPATQSMPTIPSEKQRGSSVIIVGKNPNACQEEQKAVCGVKVNE